MKDDRLYVLTRRDLPPSVRTVQAVHAVAALVSEFSIAFAEIPWVIVYGVADEPELDRWRTRLNGKGCWTAFREPDLNEQLTAIAYWGPKASGFGGLRLL